MSEENGVYQIENKNDLIEFAQMVNGEGTYAGNKKSDANAILKDNIIFNDETKIKDGVPVGSEQEEWTPIGKDDSTPYTGTFDGNGKTISGLYFDDEAQDYVGLFGYVKNGVIENIGVKNSYFKANDYVGGLIGYFYVEGKGEVTSSYSSGCTVEGTGYGAYVGGLIGWFGVGETGAVTSSYSSGCTVEGTGYGAYVGGLIGCFSVGSEGTGEVRSSYSSGCTVEGTGYGAYVGGLIGWFNVGEDGKGEVRSSYSSGCTVTGDSVAVGGLIGWFNVGKDGKGEVRSSYSSGRTVEGTGDGASVGGLIGEFSVGKGGTGEVRSSYSSGCTVTGGSGAYVGGLIGWFGVESEGSGESGEVRSSYSSGCTVTGGSGAYVGGLIGEFSVGKGGTGEVRSSYSTNTNLTATGTSGAFKGGICGNLFSGTISNCYYLKDTGVNEGLYGIGGTDSDTTGKTSPATDTEFKNGTVRDKLNTGAGKSVFKLNTKKEGHRYLLLDWEPAIELKIPVRVKINYDPSNKLETLVSKNFKHEFFRQKTGNTSWEEMLQNIHYFYTVSPVESSIKINPDGSKTQDFIFNYYIYHAQDNSGNDYKFGFNKKYPVNTYLKQDVGGGKKLYIDYGVWGRE